MEYLPIQEFSDRWNISKRRVQILCREGRIDGAKMIGNMWAIPENAARPTDARIKNPAIENSEEQSSDVRKELKKLLKKLFKITDSLCIPDAEKRTYALSAIASGLCTSYLKEKKAGEEIYNIIFKDIAGYEGNIEIENKLTAEVLAFIKEYKGNSELDNILSWSYQYSNKIVKGNIHGRTQFFTEKYMIDFLVRNISNLSTANKIVDPCAGGGNFLVECLEYMCTFNDDGNLEQQVLLNTQKLYGYDIDSDITKIALINIRLRALAILSRRGVSVSFDIWDKLYPNIFKSKTDDKICGSLSVDNRAVVNIINNNETGINDALGNADVVLTNPPFATIKGMMAEQKNFLKKYYPEANCDMCVAFLSAIYGILKPSGVCGIVSQNAWMHLKTFKDIRARLTTQYTIYKIINLGSGAFQDLSGEKSNVSLIVMGKKKNQGNKIEVLNLNELSLSEKIKTVKKESNYVKFLQEEIDGSNGYDFSEKGTLKNIGLNNGLYKDIAVPMQGTSTGNAKELVGYFWEHFGEKEWIHVSNGGGYCRWQGLNDSVVKWGENGEYIKAQKGSALRNIKYFPETQMVFSDTGTAGLNVRVLLNNQIFIASGPGIRIIKGNAYAHLALLNSRLAAYCVRIMSPKLTIAAGYIGQIPVNERVYNSVVLEKNARLCVELKQKMLSTRPNNLEYDSSFIENMPDNLDTAAWMLFNEDITNELLKLQIESKIDRHIFKEYGISKADESQLSKSVGECAYSIDGAKDVDLAKLDNYFDKLLDASCNLKRTRTSKGSLGCDGIIEFAAKDLHINPEIIVRKIQDNPEVMKKVLLGYKKLILHNTVLLYLGYNTENGVPLNRCAIKEIIAFLSDRFGQDIEYMDWMEKSFNTIHNGIFKGVPYLIYENGVVQKYDNRIAG